MTAPIAQARFIVLQQAAEWYALLESGTAGEQERAKWQRWLAADPLHADTWRQVQDISGRFRDLPPASARAALMTGAPPSPSRRAFSAMLVAAAGGVAFWQLGPGVSETDDVVAGSDASYDSAIGQLRRLRLPDGGTLLLDTDSAVRIAYDAGARRIMLRRGRVYIETASDTVQPARPLLVHTGQGVLRALGTRFEVDQLQDRTRLRVAQGAVEITPRQDAARVVVVSAGAGAQFDAAAAELNSGLNAGPDTGLTTSLTTGLNAGLNSGLNPDLTAGRNAEFNSGSAVGLSGGPAKPARVSTSGAARGPTIAAPDWTRRLLLADNLPLGDLVHELARYRRGYLGCAPEVAGLRLVGAYPLDDHEAVFAMLEASLPVRVRHRLPWWVTIGAR